MPPPTQVSTVPTASAGGAGQTQIPAVTVWLLMTADNRRIPAFNQGRFGHANNPHECVPPSQREDSPTDRFAYTQPPSASRRRTIQESGCGLCSLAGYLAVAGCRYGAGQEADLQNYPRELNRYLQSCITERRAHLAQIYQPDGAGMLNLHDTAFRMLSELADAAHGTTGTNFHFADRQRTGTVATGREIPALTAHLQSGRPAVIGVCHNGGSGTPHQVLAVGYGQVGGASGETYYIINDSGWAEMDGYGVMDGGGTIDRDRLRRFSASTTPRRGTRRTAIGWYQLLAGLEAHAPLTLRQIQ